MRTEPASGGRDDERPRLASAPRGRRALALLALFATSVVAAACGEVTSASTGGGGVLPGGAFAFRWGASGGDEAAQVISLDQGAGLVVAGTFSGSVNFNPLGGAVVRVAGGGSDAYVARYDTAGGLLWVAVIGGPGTEVGRGIARTSSGSFLVTGGAATGVTCPSGVVLGGNSGGQDAFVATITADGRCQSLLQAGSAGADEGRAVATIGDGSVFVTGTYAGTADFDPTSAVLALAPSVSGDVGDVFVARYTAAFGVTWALRIGSRGADAVAALRLDPAGNPVVAGTFGDSLRITTTTGALVPTMPMPNRGGSDVWVASVQPSGAFRWAARAGSPTDDRLSAHALAFDATGTAFLGGTHSGALVLGDGVGIAPVVAIGGGADALVWRVADDGRSQAGFTIGGAGTDAATGLLALADGDLLVAGGFQDSVDFSRGLNARRLVATSPAGSAGADIFVARYAPTGAMRWAQRLRPSAAPTAAPIATFAAAGQTFWLGGRFTGAMNVDPAATVATLTSAGSTDAWMARYRPDSGLLVRR